MNPERDWTVETFVHRWNASSSGLGSCPTQGEARPAHQGLGKTLSAVLMPLTKHEGVCSMMVYSVIKGAVPFIGGVTLHWPAWLLISGVGIGGRPIPHSDRPR